MFLSSRSTAQTSGTAGTEPGPGGQMMRSAQIFLLTADRVNGLWDLGHGARSGLQEQFGIAQGLRMSSGVTNSGERQGPWGFGEEQVWEQGALHHHL